MYVWVEFDDNDYRYVPVDSLADAKQWVRQYLAGFRERGCKARGSYERGYVITPGNVRVSIVQK